MAKKKKYDKIESIDLYNSIRKPIAKPTIVMEDKKDKQLKKYGIKQLINEED